MHGSVGEVRAVSAGAARAVLVTGASSGIGRSITERLARDGHFVYAGARKSADLHSLGLIANVQPLRLDVTDPGDITAAVKTIVCGGRGLYGLVNNAGVATLGGVLDGDESEFDLVMKVNAYGPYRISRAVARLIIAARGRIVSIGSISGILAGASVCAYSMSKHALEALTDALAEEMTPFGVHVSVIEPGKVATDLVRNATTRMGHGRELPDLSCTGAPEAVAAVAALALFEPVPKRRYLLAASDEVEATIRKQIEQLVQLNEEHPGTYDRAALVSVLDRELAHAQRRRTAAIPNPMLARA
jgi:NAD(P)-dependent dehydrogenase (short-subunit alcohol dehydrogenase family)